MNPNTNHDNLNLLLIRIYTYILVTYIYVLNPFDGGDIFSFILIVTFTEKSNSL